MLLWNQEVLNSVHKIPPLMSQFNTVHVLSEIHFNIILTSMPRTKRTFEIGRSRNRISTLRLAIPNEIFVLFSLYKLMLT